MILREATIKDKKRWDSFLETAEGGSFVQSWDWGEFMKTQKDKTWRYFIEERGEIVAVMFLFLSKLKLGQPLLYSPKGPVISSEVDRQEAWNLFVSAVDQLAEEEGVLTFQLDPETNDKEWCLLYDKAGFLKSKIDIQPRHTLILDIRKDLDMLMAQMHQKTRYNIRLAEKKMIKVSVNNNKSKELIDLLKKTEERQRIQLFGAGYFEKLLQCPLVNLYLAEYAGKVVATNIVIFWNRTAIYLFGASDYEARALMAPYLLQWQSIKDAKEKGMWFYDFWGAAPEKAKGQEQGWAGFTRFKKGFSPNAEITEYLGAYEKNYQPVKLGLYRFLRKMYSR